MGRPTWANDKQYEFLQSQGELFKVYQIDKKAAKAERKPAPIFWQLFFQAWENQWPNPALGDLVNPLPGGQQAADEGGSASSAPTAEGATIAESDPTAEGVTSEPSKNKTKRGPLTVQLVSNSNSVLDIELTFILQKRLKDWIQNYAKKAVSTVEKRPAKLDLSGRKKMKWQPVQAFSHLYYHSLKDQLTEEYTVYCALLPVGQEPEALLSWRNRRLKELYDKAEHDVKAAVDKLRAGDASVADIKAVEDLLAEGLLADDILKSVRKR